MRGLVVRNAGFDRLGVVGSGSCFGISARQRRGCSSVACRQSGGDVGMEVALKSVEQHQARTKRMNLYEAINDAMRIVLESDPTAIVFGEDVAFGGVFRCSASLRDQFGPERVFNTPLSEQGIVGFGIGYAATGGTAVAEIQFADYIYTAFDQLVNEAAKFRYRSGGEYDVGGLTVRAPSGAVGHGGHYHSQSPEAYFCHTPGLVIVTPREPLRAKGLLLSSVRNRNPVLFFEPKALYRASVAEVPVGDYELPLGKGEIVRTGTDVTLVGWGAQVHTLHAAAETVQESRGISCEVIDLMTLAPYDEELVTESVRRTGRAIVSHEAPRSAGLGAEIAAMIQENCFLSLSAPVARVCGFDTPFPLVHEDYYLPSKLRVLDAIEDTLSY